MATNSIVELMLGMDLRVEMIGKLDIKEPAYTIGREDSD
jgi:hypothetical protein